MIKSISVANLGPFKGEQHVDLKSGILSIEGRYSDKPGESNRAGKSSFLDLIRFGYFGVHRHRVFQNYIHKHADPRNDPVYLSMEIEDSSGHVYHIIREFDYNRQSFTVRVPEIEDLAQLKQHDIQLAIENRLLGCTYSDAIKTWMVLQDDARGLMNLSVANRKQFLLDLFVPKMFPWDSYFAETSTRHTMCKTRQSEILSRITSLRNKLLALADSDFDKAISVTQQEILEATTRRDTVSNLLSDLEATESQEALAELSKKVADHQKKLNDMTYGLRVSRKTLDKLERDVERLNAKHKMLAELRSKQQQLQAKADKLRIKETEDEYGRVYDQHKELSTQLSLNLQRYKELDKFQGICPVTHENCVSGGDIRQAKAVLKKSIETATQTIDALQSKLDGLVVTLDANERTRRDLDIVNNNIAAAEAVVDSLTSTVDIYKEHKAQNRKDEKEYLTFKSVVEQLQSELDARRTDHDLTYQRRLRELKQEYSTLTQKIQQLEAKLITLIADQQRKDVLEQDLADSQQEFDKLGFREQVLRSLKPILSPSGIPFTALLSSIIDFETEVNAALADLGDDILIDVEPYTVTNAKAPTCYVCGYEFGNSQVTKCPIVTCRTPREYKKKETLEVRLKGRLFDVEFDEDSGGGKQKVAIAIRLALFNILRSKGLMTEVDIWCLDEIFAPLSDIGKFNMLNALDNVCNQYNIKQMFLVTHTDISSIIPPAVIIERSDTDQESRILA